MGWPLTSMADSSYCSLPGSMRTHHAWFRTRAFKITATFHKYTAPELKDVACIGIHPSVAGILNAQVLNQTRCARIPPGKTTTSVTGSIVYPTISGEWRLRVIAARTPRIPSLSHLLLRVCKWFPSTVTLVLKRCQARAGLIFRISRGSISTLHISSESIPRHSTLENSIGKVGFESPKVQTKRTINLPVSEWRKPLTNPFAPAPKQEDQ